LLQATRPRLRPGDEKLFASLAADVADLRAFTGLPRAFGHADAVPRNVITGDAQAGPTIIDWAGAGWFPRVASLGCLLWAAAVTGRGAVQAAARGYAQIVELDPAELEVLGHTMRTRPLVLAVWTYATGRSGLAEVHESWQAQRAAIDRANAAAVAALRD